MNIQIMLTFILYFLASVIIAYYYNLLISKNEYSRDEIQEILPQLKSIWNKISSKYPPLKIFFIIAAAGAAGLILPLVFSNKVINSALIPLCIYLFLPKAAVYFEETRVTSSESITDLLEDIYVKYYLIINSSFIAAYGSALIYNWADAGIIPFYWFLVNFSVITVFLVITIKEMIYD